MPASSASSAGRTQAGSSVARPRTSVAQRVRRARTAGGGRAAECRSMALSVSRRLGRCAAGTEDPAAEQDEAQRRWRPGSRRRGRRARRAARRGRQRARARTRERCRLVERRAARPNTASPWTWWRTRRPRPRTPKVQPPVGRGVGDRGQQRGRARFAAWRRPGRAERGRATRVGERARRRRSTANREHLARRTPSAAGAAAGRATATAAPAEVAQQPPRRRAGRPTRGRDDVDTAVGVVDPVDRHLVDAQPGALGQHEQLGVEEPAAVLDERQQLPGAVGPDRLEAALRVGEAVAQRRVQERL